MSIVLLAVVLKRKKYTKLGLTYVNCRVCHIFYVNPRPTEKILEWFYESSENYKYWNEVIFPASDNTRRKQFLSHMLIDY